MGRNIEVRIATVDDAQAMAEIQNAVNVDMARRENRANTARIRTAGPIREGIEMSGGQPLSSPYVVVANGLVVGSLYVGLEPPDFWNQELWEDPRADGLGIFGFNIHPNAQRHGYGSALMLHVEQVALENGIEFVRLDTYPHMTQAVNFYLKLGYIDRGRCQVAGKDLIQFEKNLTQS